MAEVKEARKADRTLLLEIFAFVLVFSLVNIVNKANFKGVMRYEGRDIMHEFQTAVDILRGANPYARVLSGDLLINQKYATLFPLYYFFLLLLAVNSHLNYYEFLPRFFDILGVAELATSVFIYLFFRRKDMKLLGFVASGFFLFNRWSINIMSDLKQDFIAISLLVSSLYFLETKRKLSYFLYGLSLGIKHLGIFIFPVYLVPLIFGQRSPRQFLSDLALLALPIAVPSLFFILDNYRGFLYSMLFSFTRKPVTTSVPFGYDELLIFYDIGVQNNRIFYYLIPRLPLVVFFILNTILLFTNRIRKSFFVLTSLFIFIAFNPVLFDQYLAWVVPILFVSISDYLPERGLDGKV